MGARFSASFQTDPGTHPSSFITGTGYFPVIKGPGGGVELPPPTSPKVKEAVELYFYSISGLSYPVLGCNLYLLLRSVPGIELYAREEN